MTKLPLALFVLSASLLAHAEAPYNKRLTFKDTKESKLKNLIKRINKDTGLDFSKADFVLLEDRDLATSHFSMYAQAVKGVPVDGKSIRIWRKRGIIGDIFGGLIQAEINLDKEAKVKAAALAARYDMAMFSPKALNSTKLASHVMSLVNNVVKASDDKQIMAVLHQDRWVKSDLVRSVTVKSRRGEHIIDISLMKNSVVSSSYSEYPQADISVKAKVYPIYEEAENTKEILPRIDSELKYLDKKIHVSDSDPYEVMRDRKYSEEKYDVLLAETEEGRKLGYWSTPMLKRQAKEIADNLPREKNKFGKNGGLVLSGKYATINLHPQAKIKFPGINFTPKHSTQFMPSWQESSNGSYEVVPQSGYLGKLVQSQEELLSRPARRLPDHDPTSYINDGFDEVQVYWAVTTLVDSLQKNGYNDPELSTRPFNAYLYDPDIGMRDNAYYTDDTINFTTYSPDAINYARDNSTIWHELGHGIMDRLMGDYIRLADTGGLSEGMADFCAALVVQDIMKDKQYPGSQDYRIINHTGFFLTNEVHDDGEAYGGTMKDILNASLVKYGPEAGLAKMTDLTMEAMRLTRNNPGLTAQDWFAHMLFADEMDGAHRKAGEMKDLILKSLAGRNFSMEGKPSADLTITNLNSTSVLTSSSPGSRENPIRLSMKAGDSVSYNLKVQLKSTETYAFQYPVTVKLEFKKGALQGAIKWEGEEQNPMSFTLNSEKDELVIPVTAYGECDAINQEDGSCKDYAYIQVFNKGDGNKPSAKKRFYLRITPQ
ncbi:MAG: hypothetical protein ACOYL6_06765 [Bacteriovoracaceae bacterium]